MNKGQSLFEVVLAIAVITLIITAIASLAANSLRNAVYSRNKTLSTRYAQEAVEWLRGERDQNFTDFQTKSTTAKWCLVDLIWSLPRSCGDEEKISGTTLKRELNFALITKSGKTVIEATVVVSWEDAQGLHETTTITYFTDWRRR